MPQSLFSKIKFINLYSLKNQELIAFYRDVVKVPVLPGQDPTKNWFGFATEGVTLAIEPAKNKQNYPFVADNYNQVLIQFLAETPQELEAMNQQLEAGGVKLLRRSEKMSYGTITNFLDPDENLMEIILEES